MPSKKSSKISYERLESGDLGNLSRPHPRSQSNAPRFTDQREKAQQPAAKNRDLINQFVGSHVFPNTSGPTLGDHDTLPVQGTHLEHLSFPSKTLYTAAHQSLDTKLQGSFSQIQGVDLSNDRCIVDFTNNSTEVDNSASNKELELLITRGELKDILEKKHNMILSATSRIRTLSGLVGKKLK